MIVVKKKSLLFPFFLLLMAFPQILSAGSVVVPEGTPFFFDEALVHKAGITAMESFETECVSESGSRHVFFLEKNTRNQGNVLRRVEIVECRLPGLDGTFWFSPQVKIDPENNFHVEKSLAWDSFSAGVIFFLLFASGFLLLKKMEAGSVKRCLLLAIMAALLHCGFLSLALWRNGFAIPIVKDDIFYMQTAELIRSGNFSETMFRYTIGYPILCVPYTFLIPHAGAFQEFFPIAAFVNGFLISALFSFCSFLLSAVFLGMSGVLSGAWYYGSFSSFSSRKWHI